MDAVIKILGGGGQTQHVVPLTSDRFTIGRGYNNDLVLEDPYLCAQHLSLEKEGEGWRIRNLSSINGIKFMGRLIDDEGVLIHSGDELKMGQTRLCLFDPSHVVAPAKLLDRRESWILALGQPTVWAWLVVLVSLFFCLESYQLTFIEFEITSLLEPMLSNFTPVILLAGVWAIAGRIFRHQPRFFIHFSIILLAWLCYGIGKWLLHILGYNAGLEALTETGGIILWLIVSAVVIWVNLYLATNLNSRAINWAVVGMASLLLAFALSDEIAWDHIFNSRPDYYSALEPPWLLFNSGVTEAELTNNIQTIFDLADELAQEEP